MFTTQSETKVVSPSYSEDYVSGEIEDVVRYLDDDKDPSDFLHPASIIAAIVSIVLALIIFFGFVIRKKDPNGGIAKWWKEFLNFRKIWIAGLMKFIYLLGTISLFALGIVIIVYAIWWGKETGIMILVGLGVMTLGNIALRLVFEMTMLMVGLWENTADIRGAIVGARQRVEAKRAAVAEPKPEEKPEPKPAAEAPQA